MRAIDADRLEKVLISKGIYPAVVRRAILDAPTLDAPTLDMAPVVRCRDCKYNRSERKCLHPDSIMLTPGDDDFCSYGQRMEGNNGQ